MAIVYSPDHPLRSAQLKVEWADVNIRRLNKSLRIPAGSPEIARGRKRELQSGGNLSQNPPIYELELTPRIRQQWSLIVGDILTNLRASLDHVAWALAIRFAADRRTALTDKEERLVSYPLRNTPVAKNIHIGGLNLNDVKFFPSSSHATVEQFQPYNRTNRPELKFLGVLNDLVDQDKHRVVTPTFQEFRVRFTGDDQIMRTSLDKPYKQWFLLTEPVPGDFKPEVTAQIVLNVPFLFPDNFAVSDFRLIHNLIRDEVIPAFARFVE